jgi:hypothetical protein
MSETLTVLRPNPDGLAVLDDLTEPLERRIWQPMIRAGYDAPLPVLTRYPAPLEVRYTDRGTTLTAAHYLEDPLVAHEGGLIRAPESERRKLEALRSAGIDPDLVWILREMPGQWSPGEEPPRMLAVETAETARTRHLQHLQVGAAAFVVGRAFLYTAGAAFALAAGATVAVGAITIGAVGAVALAPLASGLDPIMLAGVVHHETGGVAWTVVAAWDEIPDGRSW